MDKSRVCYWLCINGWWWCVRAIVCCLVVVAENACEENRIMRKNGEACYIFIFIGKYEEIMKSLRCFDKI